MRHRFVGIPEDHRLTTMTIYHNPRCSKSRAALQLLEQRGVTPTVVRYLDSPPTAAELAEILAKMGRSPREVMRPKEAREEGIADLDGDALIAALAAHPRALERPIVVTEHGAALGRPPEAVLDLIED